MQAQLAPCQDLEELIERPGAPRQHHDRVGIHEHDLLALMHRLGDDEGREIALAHLHVHQVAGDHAEGRTARSLCGARHGAHQAHIARAIDQPMPGLRQSRSQGGRVRHVFGIRPGARAAIDTYRRAWHGIPCAWAEFQP
jgi:hypothetical protein